MNINTFWMTNLQNILGAVGVGLALGIEPKTIARGVDQLKSVPGRLEKVANRLDINILVDYAHSPDALEKVLAAVRPRLALVSVGAGNKYGLPTPAIMDRLGK